MELILGRSSSIGDVTNFDYNNVPIAQLKSRMEAYLVACLGKELMQKLNLKPTTWIGESMMEIIDMMPFEIHANLMELMKPRILKKKSPAISKLLHAELHVDHTESFRADRMVFQKMMNMELLIWETCIQVRSDAFNAITKLPTLSKCIDHFINTSRKGDRICWWETFSNNCPPAIFAVAANQNVSVALGILKHWNRFVGDEYWRESLIERHYPVNSGCTVAHYAAQHSESPEVVLWLTAGPSEESGMKSLYSGRIDLDAVDVDGNTISHYAARNLNGKSILKSLQIAEMDRNISDQFSSIDTFTYSILKENRFRQTPLHIAAQNSSHETFLCALSLAACALQMKENSVLADRPEIAVCAAMNSTNHAPQILTTILFHIPSVYYSHNLLSVAIENNNALAIEYLSNYMERHGPDENDPFIEDDSLFYVEEDDNDIDGIEDEEMSAEE